MGMDFRYNRVFGTTMAFAMLHGFLPPARAKTPFAACCQTDTAQVVAVGGGEIVAAVCERCWEESVEEV